MNGDSWNKLHKRKPDPSRAQQEFLTLMRDSPNDGLRGIRARNGVDDPPILMPAGKKTRR